LRQHPASNAAAFRAVTMLETSFARDVTLDRILQKVNQHRRSSSAKVCVHVKWLRFRRDFPANDAKAASPVRFGTAALSELSAFATMKHRAERSRR